MAHYPLCEWSSLSAWPARSCQLLGWIDWIGDHGDHTKPGPGPQQA
jgi:hypothetical protein